MGKICSVPLGTIIVAQGVGMSLLGRPVKKEVLGEGYWTTVVNVFCASPFLDTKTIRWGKCSAASLSMH